MENLTTFDFWFIVVIVTIVVVVAVAFIRDMVDIEQVAGDVLDLIIAATPVVFRMILCFLAALGLVSIFWVLFV